MSAALSLAVEAAGSISALSRKLNVSHQVANRWIKRGYVPLQRARQISTIYGLPMRELVAPALRELIDDAPIV